MPTDVEGGNPSQNDGDNVAIRDANGKPAKRDPIISARDQLMADMDAKVLAARAQDDESFFQSADPRALVMAAEMGREPRGEPTIADGVQGSDADAGAEAEPVVSRQDAAAAQARQQTQVTEAGDPLAEFVVRDSAGKPMFKTVVNGQVRLVPLERAREQLQKHLSADARLQQAANERKQLEAREARLRAQPVLKPVVVDEAALEKESAEIIRSLVSEPEAVAAKKLATALKSIRTAQPQIDVNAIARQATIQARQEIAAEDNQRALATGLTKFQTTYPEITEGSELYLVADRKTTAIAEENPNWSPEQVMLEAGRQTREWVKSLGAVPGKTPIVKLSDSRQQVKQQLRPMPQSRSATPAATSDTGEDNSPQSTMAEIRKSRGQAY